VPRAGQTDENLVEQASGGDERALATIFRRYQDDLFRYCVALLGNADDAADALQNTMVKVLRALPGERRRLNLKPWLYRIAHNESIELVRKRQDYDSIDPDALVGLEGPEASAETRERLRQLIADLRELPERQRGSLVMRELGGLSFEQIGAAFETSAAVARQTIYEARIGLQEMESGRAMECAEVRHKLSDGDRRVFRRRDVRAHLRSCPGCGDFEAAICSRRTDLAAISPLSALAAAGVLKGVVGGAAASTGSAAGAGAAGSALTASAAAKAVATVAVAGAIGIGAAEKAGVIHVFHGGGGRASAPARAADPASAGVPGTAHRPVKADADDARVGASPATGRAFPPAAAKVNGHGDATRHPGGRTTTMPDPGLVHRTTPARSSGRGHEKGSGGGAGAANAHGGNPNAHGGNPNAKGGKHNAPTSHAQGGVRAGQKGEPGHGRAPQAAQPEAKSEPKSPAVPPEAKQAEHEPDPPPGYGMAEKPSPEQ
jgi:RNA polymerase sigma factor (sigma-70 family)